MKKLLLALIFFPFILSAQEYSEVVTVEGKTAEELYVFAREWFAVTFNSAKDVLQMDDADAGKLIGKGSTSVSEFFIAGKGLAAVPIKMDWEPHFTVKIEVRNGRYKCEITDIVIRAYNELIGSMDTPFYTYKDQQNYYRDASDPQWIINNPPDGIKIGKATARTLAQSNDATYKMIVKVDNQMQTLMDSLKLFMGKNSNDDW